MKKMVCLLALLINLSYASASLAHGGPAAKAARPLAAIRAMHANAEEASSNAGIYQWMRVNREVDRIVADMRKVDKALASDAASATSVKTLQQSVRELRSARLAHDVNRIQAAAHQIADTCDSLLAQ